MNRPPTCMENTQTHEQKQSEAALHIASPLLNSHKQNGVGVAVASDLSQPAKETAAE